MAEETGLGAELARMRYGADFGQALYNIGAQIRESKLTDQARKTLGELTGVDLSTPEGVKTFREKVFSLSQMDQPGKTALEAAQLGLQFPMQVEGAEMQQAEKLGSAYNEGVRNYMTRLSTPGSTTESLEPFRKSLEDQKVELLKVPVLSRHPQAL